MSMSKSVTVGGKSLVFQAGTAETAPAVGFLPHKSFLGLVG